MADPAKVFLHIGAPKTGTTYLQQVLFQNRDALEAAGVLYPVLHGDAHHTTVWDLRDFGSRPGFRGDVDGHWATVVEQVQAWPGSASVVSSELFVYSKAEEAARALRAFGDLEVHVIYTARDLARQIPAVWQERMKNRQVLRYEAFLDDVLAKSKKPMSKGFWTAQDAVTALHRWSQDIIAPQHVHVVTAPPSGAPVDELWRRFATVLGLDSGAYVSKVEAANTSMGVRAAELLRRYNVRYGRSMHMADFRKVVRHNLDHLLGTAVEDSKLPLSHEQLSRVYDLAEAQVAGIEKAGFDVVGDVHDLLPPRPDRAAKHSSAKGPADVTQAEMIDTLLDVLHAVLQEEADLRKRLRQS